MLLFSGNWAVYRYGTVYMSENKISNLIISKPGRYRDSLEIFISALPDFKESVCVDTIHDAESYISDILSYDLIIVNPDNENADILESLLAIKRLLPVSKLLVVADAAIWQKVKQIPDVDHVSLKGFSINQFRAVIRSMFVENDKVNMEEAALKIPVM